MPEVVEQHVSGGHGRQKSMLKGTAEEFLARHDGGVLTTVALINANLTKVSVLFKLTLWSRQHQVH